MQLPSGSLETFAYGKHSIEMLPLRLMSPWVQYRWRTHIQVDNPRTAELSSPNIPYTRHVSEVSQWFQAKTKDSSNALSVFPAKTLGKLSFSCILRGGLLLSWRTIPPKYFHVFGWSRCCEQKPLQICVHKSLRSCRQSKTRNLLRHLEA